MIQILFGENSAAARTKADQIQQEQQKKHGEELVVERVDASAIETPSHLRQLLESGSLFHAEKLVIIRDVASKKHLADWAAENIEDLQKSSTTLVLVEGKLDKRSKFYKAAKKAKVAQEFTKLSPQDAAAFAVDYAKKKQGSISRSDANALVGRVGVDQGILTNELDKLLLYDPNISRESINKLTDQTPSDSIFALTDAIVQGRASAALDLYRDLRTRQMHPLEIIATLGWQMFTLVQIKAYESEPQQTIASKTKLHPFVVQKNMPLVRRVSRQQLATAVSVVANLEEQLKTSDAGVADHSFETALLELIEQLKR